MAGNSKPPSYECAYCGSMAPATDDHIPPKCLFTRPLPSTLATVKACETCNGGASDDDEYFRDVILKYHRVADQPDAQPLMEKMFRAASLPAKRRYLEATLRSFEDVEAITDAGIFLGRQPAFRVDGERLDRTVRRYVRGLHRYELGVRVPNDFEVHVAADPERVYGARDEVIGMVAGRPAKVVQPGVFHYTWNQAVDRPEASVWVLVFFDQYPILGIVRPPGPPRSRGHAT